MTEDVLTPLVRIISPRENDSVASFVFSSLVTLPHYTDSYNLWLI